MFCMKVHIKRADTDPGEPLAGAGRRRVVAKYIAVQPPLGLLPQHIVHAGKYHDDFVACIGSLVRKSRVIRCFAGLDVTDNKAASVPATIAFGVFDLFHD